MKPISALHMPRFGGLATFSRLPYIPQGQVIPKQAKLAVLGVPFDGGTTYRPGARLGPRAIRDASVLNRNYHPQLDVDIYEKMGVFDAGDVAVNPINMKKSLVAIEKHADQLLSKNLRLIALGGDHLMAYPLLRAFKRKYGPFTLVHFDAHTDMADEAWGEKFHHGTPMRRLIEEKVLDPQRVFQVGLRGPWGRADQEDYSKQRGVHQLHADDCAPGQARDRFFDQVHETAGSKPVYISFDVDGVDPAFAPGTGTPVVGGMSSREALQCLRLLAGLRVMGGDVVEVSPAYDHAQITALLASAIAFEMMALMARSGPPTKDR